MPVAWQPVREDELVSVRHDGAAIFMWAAAALALILPVLLHAWPAALLPPAPGHADDAYNLRLFKLLLLGEGAGLGALAVFGATRGRWLRRAGGYAGLERHAGVALLALAAVHALCGLAMLPPQQILAAEPVHSGAYAAHSYRVFAAHRILADGGRFWGYDPFFMGGAPAGPAFDWDVRGEALFAHTFSFLGLSYASKAFLLLVHVALPFVLFAAARASGARPGAAWLGTWGGVVVWNAGRPLVGALRVLALHSWLGAAEVALLAVVAATEFLHPDHRRRARGAVLLLVALAAIGLLQPTALVLIVPTLAALAFAGRGLLRRRDTAAILGSVAAAALLHAALLAPVWRQRALIDLSAGAEARGALDVLALFTRPGALPAAALALAGIGTLVVGVRQARGAAVVAGSAFTWLAFALLGASTDRLALFDPVRAVVPATLLLAASAGPALARALQAVESVFGRLPASLALATLLGVPPFFALLDARFFAVHRLDATLDGGVRELLTTLDGAAPAEGRVLFETTAGRATPLSSGEPLEALVPLYTHHAVAGALRPSTIITPSGLESGDGRLDGVPFDRWSAAEVGALLARWDVTTVVAWSGAGRDFWLRFSDVLRPVATVRGFTILRTTAASRPVLDGEARVRADYNRIEMADVRSPTVLLEVNWINGLEAIPPVALERVPAAGTNRGFIRVYTGHETRVTLRPCR